ncbi:MAG: ABC transporter permease, partial [Bacilli bacterium]|nr:ABC transporter permease [Bacilli bacterium]
TGITFTPTGTALIYRFGFYEMLGWGDGDIHGGYRNFPLPNQYLVHLDDPSSAESKEDLISEAYRKRENNNLYLIQTLDETSFMSTLMDEVSQAQKLTFVFPIVFFVVALLVILTNLRQNILKRRTEIGTFKALGLTKREIHFHFLSQTGLLVVIASLIGSLIGPFILPEIMAHKYDILFTLPAKHYYFPLASALISIAIFILVSLLVTFLITRQEISLKPVESMRPKAIKIHRQIRKSKTSQESSFALSAKMAGRNLLYDPVKSLMVIVGVLGCTALLVCGFGIDDTLSYDIQTDPYVNSFSQCMASFLSAETPEKIEADFSKIEDSSGGQLITSYQPYERFSLEIVSSESTYTSYLFLLGNQITYDGAKAVPHMDEDFPKDEIALSQKVADKLKVHVGDSVKFYVQDAYIEAKIHKIYDAFFGNGIIMHTDSPLFDTPYPDFHFAWVEGKDATTLADKLLELDYCASVDTYADWLERIHNIVSSISTMTAAIKVFAILLAIVVLYNLALLNFRERIRGIATLKVLGFHTVEIAIGLFIEALSMTILGIIGGLFVGFPFMKLVLMINQVEVIHYIFMIFPHTYVFAALFSLSIAFGVNALMSYRIKNVRSVESLKSVE